MTVATSQPLTQLQSSTLESNTWCMTYVITMPYKNSRSTGDCDYTVSFLSTMPDDEGEFDDDEVLAEAASRIPHLDYFLNVIYSNPFKGVMPKVEFVYGCSREDDEVLTMTSYLLRKCYEDDNELNECQGVVFGGDVVSPKSTLFAFTKLRSV